MIQTISLMARARLLAPGSSIRWLQMLKKSACQSLRFSLAPTLIVLSFLGSDWLDSFGLMQEVKF